MLSALVPNAVIRRRLMFASAFLPKEYPFYWDMVMKFAAAKSPGNLFVADADKRKLSLTMENLRLIYPAAFSDDDELSKQLVHMEMPGGGELGVILVSDKCMCCKCGGALALRSDRPSHLTIYSEALGTVTGTHYHKTCKYPGCKVVQYYGYTTSGSKLGATYDSDWSDLTYFVSSQETAFETSFLKKMDADLLIGQLSYRQKADIYNYYNGYHNFKKQHSKLDASKKGKQSASRSNDRDQAAIGPCMQQSSSACDPCDR